MSINLDWHQKDKYYIQSKCGYRVTKCGGVYTAWTNLKMGKRKIIRAGLNSSDAAKAECELHKIKLENGNES